MIFLPSVSKLLAEASRDPSFQELLDASYSQMGHINLTGMTETQKAYLIAAMTYERKQRREKEGDKNIPVPVILVSDELSARRFKSYLDAFFEKETVILRGRETHLSAVSASSREIEQGRVRTLVKYATRECGAMVVTADVSRVSP